MSCFLTIGMPSFSNFSECYFTIQALRMYHSLENYEILVVDNFGDPELEKFIKNQGALYDTKNIWIVPDLAMLKTKCLNLLKEKW